MSYIDLTIDGKSLGAWIGKLSGEEARSRKRGQIKVVEIAAHLWPPGGRPPEGLPIAQRNKMIRDEEAKRYKLKVPTLDPKTINAALRQNGK